MKISESETAEISLVVDLSEELKTGKRVRMDIEKPDDLEIFVGDERYEMNAYYPLRGEYLSIGRPRPVKE